MFNFMKKGVGVGDDRDEKERRKKEKKLRKEGKGAGVSGSMSTEELLRLDEVRRSLKIRGRRKEKEKLPSGITADYSASFFAQLDLDREQDRGNEEVVALANTTTYIDSNGEMVERVSFTATNISQSDSSETSMNSITVNQTKVLPVVPPRPPKRGILKGSRMNLNESGSDGGGSFTSMSPDSKTVLMRNTLQNERISYPQQSRFSAENLRLAAEASPGNANHLHITTSPSPSADSLTDTTNSSFATPPFSLSPVGESQGSYRWSRVQTFDDVSLPLPAIKLVELPPPRELVINRQKTPRNDFGFSLRKAMVLDRNPSLLAPTFRPVIFAEPSTNSCTLTGLLPGDRLLKVNGLSVEDLPRATIIEMIKNSGDSVVVQVQPVAELVELSRRCMTIINDETDRISSVDVTECNTLRRSASKRLKSVTKLSQTTNQYNENPQDIGEKVWLIHRGGFTSASKLPHSISSDPGKILVQLEHNGEELAIDDDDVEKANPESLDLVEDICQLKHLNEASILHVLRQRYGNNLIHTRVGPVLMVVNPMAPLALYSEKVVSMFRGCKTEDMPPHVFSLAQTAYRTMLETRRDQSLIFMGRSGSGKTTSFKHALYYLALAAGMTNKILSAERVSAMNTILESFGNTKTCLNSNATRFTQILSLDFDHCGQIASASVQILLLEKSRAGRRSSSEHHTFHVFGRLLAGAEGHLQKELYLDSINFDENNLFVTLPTKLEDKQNASIDFARLQQSFSVLNVDQSSVKSLWYIIASIFHLGNANCSIVGNGPTARIQFANPSSARKAATLLGISMEDLTNAAFSNATAKSNPGSPVKSALTAEQTDLEVAALDSLEGFVIGLYSEVVAAAVALINKVISTSNNTIASILLIDTPGFQNPASCGQQTGASLSDLRHNYLQERLQLLFHHVTLVTPRNRYAQELVEIDTGILHDTNPAPLVNLLDKAPQNHVVRTSQNNLRDQDKRGLLWMLDEEIIYPNASDDTFIERLFSYYGDREHQSLIRKGAGTRQFILQHLQGTNPVLYSSSGWLKGSHEHASTKCAISVLQDSNRAEISGLFTSGFTRSGGTVYFGSIVGTESTQSLRRVSSIRRSFTSAGFKRNSVMLQVKFTVDGIIDTLRRTGTHFVHCYLLEHNAGTTNCISLNTKVLHSDEVVNVPLLRSQLRGSQILDFARLHRLGFPVSVPLSEFTRRFGLLADGSLGDITVENILNNNEIDSSVYRIGPSQVLFRSGVLNQLEAKRDELLSDRIIQLQAYCRGHLARKRLTQRRVQELAVKCIQRNVRAFLKVREWPWWRLLVRVTPLLNVHRTEEQLKIATTELQILKAKLEKVESERNSLKGENTKLESRLSEMTAELSEEHSSSNLISERLEAETTERLRLEKEVKEHEAKYRNLQESSEKLEMELICAKSDLNGDLDDDLEGDENGSSAYRMKYERVARELEFTKKRLQTQHEHDLEQLIGLKKQLEKKLADAYEEVEEQRQVVGQWKRKAQKMTNEMNDLRMLLEEQNSRNNLLEKRQRKFDSECQALQDSARQEKQAKERLTREKDVLIAEKFTIEQSLSDVRLELELKEEKYSALQRELEEMTFGGGTEEEIAQLKRQKMELDRRCKEQEEELDEMAGQIQLLEQAKLRLEMSLETMRKDSRKEAQQRDDELEEVRGSSYKKIKSLECQLEQEHEERTLLLREKHELERRLNNLEDQDRADRAAEEHASQKLKRDLRKYKALLRDAQSQLERVKTDSAGKTLIRQLRNQLEDAESARSAAVKARQVAENDLQDVQSMLEEAQRARFDAEDKATAAQRDRTELQAQIDENDEEMAELIKKYSTTVKQLSSEQAIIADYEIKISELETEKKSLKEQISDLTSRLENVENISDSSSSIQLKRLELRTKELESRLEFEQATRARMEIQLNRHKDSIEKAQSEMNQTRNKEIHAQEALKKAQKTIRELREELHSITNKEHESVVKRKDLEKRLESVEAEAASARADLRLALQRIADLQQAMEEGDSYHSDSENSDSSIDSMSELNYCRSSNNSSLRARSGEVNGTSSNGGSTTLCIREEKENTPRIRSKFKGTCLRRRRLPFTIKEEEEEDEVSLDSLHASVEPRERKTIKDDDDDTIGNCIESIRKALIDGAMQSNTELRVPPKHTGAIKKIFQVQSKSNESNLAEEHEGVNIPNNRTDAHCNPTDNLSDSNKQFTSESSTDTDTRKPTNSTEHCSNDDSRFDFEALKSIKEKIKNLNRNLKEEAMQEACSKTDCSNLTARMQSFELSKNESPNTRMSSFDKLDQIDSQLNLDGIRLMKEKIQKMKKKLQEESSSVTKSLSTEEITGEINEMKKTLTAAFISKNVEKDALRQSSSREECSSSMDHNSSSSSIASSIFAPTSSSATLSNLRTKASAADSENIFEKSGSITTTPSNEGGVNANYVNDAADNNNDLLECLPQCSNPIQLAAVLMNAENLPIVSVDTFQKISIATNIAKTEDEEYNVSSSLESEVLVMDNNPELRSSCEMQEYIPLEKDRNTTETIVDQQCNDNDKDSVCEKIESQDETQKVNLEKNATFFPNKYDIQTAYDENLQSEADTAHLEIDENSGNSSQILNKDPECLITEQQEDLCPAPDSADEKPCLLEEFPSRQTSEDISQVCTNSDVQEVNKVSTTCLRNICENTAMCRCENIDQIVIMLTNSMEKVERLPSNFQNKLGNDENNNSNNEKVFLQTGAPGITTNGKYNQDDTDQANVENSVCTEKLEHEKDTKAFMSMPDVYCTIETKIHAQLVSSNEIEEEVNHFKTDNNNETNSQEKVTTGEQNLTKKAFSQFIERCNQDNSDQTKVEDSVCTENLENVLLIVEKDTEVFMLMPGDDSTFKTKNHDQSSQLVSSNEVKEEIKIDNNNNNETSSPEKVTTGEQILTKKVFSNHGSLKRKPKQMDLPDSSIPSPRRSSLQNSSSTKTIYSDLAKGNTLKTAQVSSQLQNAETVDSSLNVTKPIDNITNHCQLM
ncbi:unconventional myosin-XVIIIa isoform X3 [Toxorhynchites rutilus septentrionalis]|uniref:unconventional myosin-XVIIIa isoform X3 n=1 Tax=Toxorhynchites rutilus septentrionalis TaxID=329112 RepID=UPI00247ACC02|nr:unconventional myosin-XVIIIa isoform X3 [Toxorhynchites rutilus septentrionalis]